MGNGGSSGSPFARSVPATASKEVSARAPIPVGRRTVSLLFDRDHFPTVQHAQRWAKAHGHLSGAVRSDAEHWVLLQSDPAKFHSTTYRLQPVAPGVSSTTAVPLR